MVLARNGMAFRDGRVTGFAEVTSFAGTSTPSWAAARIKPKSARSQVAANAIARSPYPSLVRTPSTSCVSGNAKIKMLAAKIARGRSARMGHACYREADKSKCDN